MTGGHWSRYAQLLQLALKHGRRDLIATAQATDLLSGDFPDEPPTAAEQQRAEALTHELERLGPTFIKFGQLLSTRSDLLPPVYLAALERLQDNVAPFPFPVVQQTIERELGRPLREAYQWFDEVPVAAASLGQVHQAALPDGRKVAVKVLRPGIREQVRGDIAAMQKLLRFAQKVSETAYRFDLLSTVDEFRRVVGRELDYRAEAVYLERLSVNLRDFPNLRVPQPILSHTRSRVLTMEWMEGRKVTDIPPAELLAFNGEALAQELFRAYLKQILVDGFYHADPHPGNVLVMPDGKLALLDLGMVAVVPDSFRDHILRLLVALADGQGDHVADVSIEVGERTELFEERKYRRLIREVVANYSATPAASVKGGRLFFVLGRAAAEAGLRMPAEFALFGKTLMNLEHVGMSLDPRFDPNDAVQRYANDIFKEHLRQGFSARAMLQTVADLDGLRRQLPSKIQRLLDQSEDGIPVRIRLAETDRFIRAIDRIANRITVGLLVAALIVSGTMWVNYPNFTIYGFPGMVVVGYVLAAGGALVLIRNVMTSND
jgi:ubiquinone biosynthesis protein